MADLFKRNGRVTGKSDAHAPDRLKPTFSWTAPDGRVVVDDMPTRIAKVPGEVDLVAQHMMDVLDALYGRGRNGAVQGMPIER